MSCRYVNSGAYATVLDMQNLRTGVDASAAE
jgi:hypothetical protein